MSSLETVSVWLYGLSETMKMIIAKTGSATTFNLVELQ